MANRLHDLLNYRDRIRIYYAHPRVYQGNISIFLDKTHKKRKKKKRKKENEQPEC